MNNAVKKVLDSDSDYLETLGLSDVQFERIEAYKAMYEFHRGLALVSDGLRKEFSLKRIASCIAGITENLGKLE